MIDKISLLAVLPDLVLFLMACLIPLFDLAKDT